MIGVTIRGHEILSDSFQELLFGVFDTWFFTGCRQKSQKGLLILLEAWQLVKPATLLRQPGILVTVPTIEVGSQCGVSAVLIVITMVYPEVGKRDTGLLLLQYC